MDAFVFDNANRSNILVSANKLKTTSATTNAPEPMIIADGTTAGNRSSGNPVISPDGRWIAYFSGATNLLATNDSGAGYGNFFYLYKAMTGANMRLACPQASGPDSRLQMTPDGQRFLLSTPSALHLLTLPDYTNWTVYSGATLGSALSPNGRYLAYATTSWKRMRILDVDAAEVRDQWDDEARQLSFSSNSLFLAFVSTNGGILSNSISYDQVFVRDLLRQRTLLASVNREGKESGNGHSTDPHLSGDGRYVVFTSTASDLMAGDTNGCADVFVRDLWLGSTLRVSALAGREPNGPSANALISADGGTVVFESFAENLTEGDHNHA